jgi:hypothetical protein
MMNLGMNFVSIPEGGLMTEGNPGLDRDQVLSLFNQENVATNNATMLNPINVKEFMEMIADGDM